MEVIRFEDERWRTFSQKTEFRHTAALSLITKGPVLDVGCGDGLLMRLLSDKGVVAQGVDVSPEAVLRCQEHALSARLLEDFGKLPYPDGAFETVVLLDVLEHVYDPVLLLSEASRVARTEVVISVPNFSSLPVRLQVMGGSVPENNRPHKGHVYWFNKRSLEVVVHKAGLTIDAMHMNTFSLLRIFGSLAPRFAPGLFALSFVARLQKKNPARND